jgi:hypothetical protein
VLLLLPHRGKKGNHFLPFFFRHCLRDRITSQRVVYIQWRSVIIPVSLSMGNRNERKTGRRLKEIEFPFYKYKHEGVQYTRSMSINVIRRVIIDSVSKKQ